MEISTSELNYLLEAAAEKGATKALEKTGVGFIGSAEAMKLLGCGRDRLNTLRESGAIPSTRKEGKNTKILYSKSGIIEYIKSQADTLKNFRTN